MVAVMCKYGVDLMGSRVSGLERGLKMECGAQALGFGG